MPPSHAPAVPSPPRRSALRRSGLRLSILESIPAQTHAALTGLGVGGNAMTYAFALWLGAGSLELGLLAAMPTLGVVVQLWSAQVGRRLRHRKATVIWTSTAGRALWVLAPALSLGLGPCPAAVWAFAALFLLGSALLAFSGNLWVAWMADLVPARVRARYFAARSAVFTATGVLVGFGAGVVMDRVENRAWAFSALHLVAAAAGGLCGLLLHLQPELPRAAPPVVRPLELRGLFQRAWAVPRMAHVLVFVACWGASNGLAAPFWQAWQQQQLGLPYAVVSGALPALQGVAAVVSYPWWGRWSARHGHARTLGWAAALMVPQPLLYALATPERPWPMALDAVLQGVALAGFGLAVFNRVLQVARGPDMEEHYAVYVAVAGLSGSAASVLAGLVSHLVEQAGTPPRAAHAVAMGLTLLGRMACVAWWRRPQASGT